VLPNADEARSTWRPATGPQVDRASRAPLVLTRKGLRRAGRYDVPGIFVTDPAEVWRLPDPTLTEVRLRNVPV